MTKQNSKSSDKWEDDKHNVKLCPEDNSKDIGKRSGNLGDVSGYPPLSIKTSKEITDDYYGELYKGEEDIDGNPIETKYFIELRDKQWISLEEHNKITNSLVNSLIAVTQGRNDEKLDFNSRVEEFRKEINNLDGIKTRDLKGNNPDTNISLNEVHQVINKILLRKEK